MRSAFAFVCLLAACHPAPHPRAPAAASFIELDGDPNGLLWDAPARTLYIADDAHDRILAWTDAGGVRTFAQLPAAAAHGLGQLARGPDGTLYVTRFGFGAAGGVAYVRADGTTGLVPGVDPARRRIGLAVASDGALYDAWFEKHGDGPGGEVARLDLDGHETPVVTGLRKPVGLLVLGSTLYVSDQAAGHVVRAPLASPASAAIFTADVPGVDLLCAGAAGTIFAGGGASVYRIDGSGHAAAVVNGLPKVRGVAYDEVGRRLFVAEHGLEPGRTRHVVRIQPLPSSD